MAEGDAIEYVTFNAGFAPVGSGDAAETTTFNAGFAPVGSGDAAETTTFNATFPQPINPGTATEYVTFNVSIPAVVPVPGTAQVIDLQQWPDEADVALVTPVLAGERSDSAVLLADGRVLYVFVESDLIKQGYAPSVEAFFAVDGSVTDITTLWADSPGPNCCVFKTPDGRVFLATSANPDSVLPEMQGTHVWFSPSGLGGDWIHRGTVQDTRTLTDSTWINMDTGTKSVGQPYIGSDGSWLLPAPVYQQYNDGNTVISYKHSGVWRSTNEGYTWAVVASAGHGIVGGPYGIASSRNINGLGDRLFWQSTGQGASSSNSRVFYSDNEGASWDSVSLGINNFATFPLRDDTYVYRVGSSGTVTRSNNPGTGFDNFEPWRQYPMASHNGAIIQPLGKHYAYMQDGKVLALKAKFGGWQVGSLAFG